MESLIYKHKDKRLTSSIEMRSAKINKMVKFSLVSVSVIMLFLHECNCARIPLQVDITKMAQCDDSKRAGNGDKVGETLY